MNIVVISPSTKSLQDMSLMLQGGNPSRVITCHEGGISKLRNLAEQERPDVIIVEGLDRKSTRLNSSHPRLSRMPSSA